MGLFGWFRGTPARVAAPIEDCVWLDSDARLSGLRARLGGLPRRPALVVARDRHGLDAIATALSSLGAHGLDGRLDLRTALEHARAPGGLALIDADAVDRATPTAHRIADLTVHVIGRALRRSDDARLFDAIARWHDGRVLVHSALDDALLKPHAEKIEPLLRRMGITADQPVESPLIAQAMRRAQRD